MKRLFSSFLALALLALVGCTTITDLDYDGDGYDDDVDCAPQDPRIFPGADDPFGDGIDQNCDGVDGVDSGVGDDDSAGDDDDSTGDDDDDLGDDKSDILIGAPYSDDGDTDAGKTYLFFGSTVASGGSFNLNQADASFIGESSEDYSGLSVSSAGDVDADGKSDLLIGAPDNDDEAGKTYLFFGSTVASGGNFNLSVADASFVGETSGDNSGAFVSSAGDVDADGKSDLLIGAPFNKTYLFFGSTVSSGGDFDLSLADASFIGKGAGTPLGPVYSGRAVSSADDVDNDGKSDLLIGAPFNDDGGDGAGKTYLFFGSTVASGGNFNLSVADASFVGENDDDRSGDSVSSAGDVDADGKSDLLIGAPLNNDGGDRAGKTYLFFGSTVASGGNFNLSVADASFVGENDDDRSGYSVSSAGDVDADGKSDLLIGAPCNFNFGTFSNDYAAGKTYLFLGSTVAAGGSFDLSLADASFIGEDYSGSGWSVSSAGGN